MVYIDMSAGFKYQQEQSQKQKQDMEFLNWLSPSHWLVEEQLLSFRHQKGTETLQWARNLAEFQTWRNSEVGPKSNERILWIRGPLGVGKSIMAGYFIDLLRCLYPEAIVAYFFCRKGQKGLTKARDIIRTLSYQCIHDDNEARSALEALRTKDFKIEGLGLGILIEKLLLDPLRRTQKDIYIVLDGLDEVDLEETGESAVGPEIEVLLDRLNSLSSSRLLFISRPEANVTKIIPNSICKAIGRKENNEDIQKYVKEFIARSEKMQTHFKTEGLDPVNYFLDKANGIFLWVVLVLKNLERARSTSLFRKRLLEFSKASGDMELLYASILSGPRFDDEAREWLREIIIWLVVGVEKLDLQLLKELVESSLGDQLPAFQEFVEVECGSLLQLVSISEKEETHVELIHETLRTYLVNRAGCLKEFYVNEATTHNHAFEVCLQVLSSGSAPEKVTHYAIKHWIDHLNQADLNIGSLSTLEAFFESQSLKVWLRHKLSFGSVPDFFGDIYLDTCDLELRNIMDALAKWATEWHTTVQLEQFAAAQWALDIVKKPERLEQYVGKASAELWLYEDLRYARGLFCIALKYFCKSIGWRMDNIDELKLIACNEFASVSQWVGTQKGSLNRMNLAIGYATLGLWAESTMYLGSHAESENSDVGYKISLAVACIGAGNYERAIEELTLISPRSKSQHMLLIQAYRTKGDLDGVIRAFEDAGLSEYEWSTDALYLGEAYNSKGDHEGEIKTYERLVESQPCVWWGWKYLSAAYKAKGDTENSITTYRRALEQNPAKEWALTGLRNAQMIRDKVCKNTYVGRAAGSEPLGQNLIGSRPQ